MELSTRLYLGDCRDVMAEMDADSVDALVTDPPYGLNFMGKGWDHGVPGVAFWTGALRVAKPGAHLLAFGGTRTFHRLACAIEDAGWEIRDTVMWVYGQGFPKSHSVDKAIDKAAGAEREVVVGVGHHHATDKAWVVSGGRKPYQKGDAAIGEPILAPATPAAKQWQGWGTALKPAVENIIVARKPVADGAALSIIVGNLLRLEAQLWLLLHVNTADGSSGSSQNGFEEAFATAQWTVDELLSTRDALCAQTDMSLFESVTNTSLNTVSSWRSIWGEALRHGNTFTIEAATSPIIGLRTLSYSVSALTPQAIIWAAMIQPGSWWSVLPAASVLNVAAMKLSATLERFAVENAIEQGHIPHPDAVDQAVLSRPIIVARKPLQGTVAANVLKWGTGGLNIGGCRVGAEVVTSVGPPNGGRKFARRYDHNAANIPNITKGSNVGRWPSNLIHDGSEEVLALFPERDGGAFPRAQRTHNASSYSVTGGSLAPARAMGDSGSAARFFYCAKASKADRDEGLDGMEATHFAASMNRRCLICGHSQLSAHPCECEAPRWEEPLPRRNHHPTVKPTALMRYLCRLVTPPGGVVLDPFMGSGSTGKAAILEGFRFIGIEVEPEYHAIAERRIAGARQPLTLPTEAAVESIPWN